MSSKTGRIIAVSAGGKHSFTKPNQLAIRLVEGHGIEGDVHAGPTMKGERGAIVPNTRQVHLMHAELFAELAPRGHVITAGAIGENITTEGVDLLSLPVGTRLHLGETAIVELTGLRAPCSQVEKFQKGLIYELARKEGGKLRIKSGVMSVVLRGGDVLPGDEIRVELPDGEHRELEAI